jgi:hypothetical protein
MREKKTHHARQGHDKENIKTAQQVLLGKISDEDEIEYGRILVNLFGIEFYTPETPLKEIETDL